MNKGEGMTSLVKVSEAESEMTLEEKYARVAYALERIIAYIDPMRPEHWHIYPTILRDQAVGALVITGWPVKSYDQYVKEMGRE